MPTECVGEKYGDHQLLHGSTTKGRDRPAAGGGTHLSRTRAGRSRLRENAEAGKITTTPRKLWVNPRMTPRCPCGGSAWSAYGSRTSWAYNSRRSSRWCLSFPPTVPRVLHASAVRFPSAPAQELVRRVIWVLTCAARCGLFHRCMFFRFSALVGAW